MGVLNSNGFGLEVSPPGTVQQFGQLMAGTCDGVWQTNVLSKPSFSSFSFLLLFVSILMPPAPPPRYLLRFPKQTVCCENCLRYSYFRSGMCSALLTFYFNFFSILCVLSQTAVTHCPPPSSSLPSLCTPWDLLVHLPFNSNLI